MKRNLAIFTAKVIKKLSQLSGKGGSNLPGEFARKIDRNILRKLRKDVKALIFITGTNGKTTTSTLLGHIFQINHNIIWNKEGSNLITGITTAFIDKQPIIGKHKIDYAIIEIDEGSIPQVLEEITPDYLLGLNLYPDQIDRYGSPKELALRLRNVLKNKGIKFILNANDPYISFLGLNEDATYFGLNPDVIKSIQTKVIGFDCVNCGAGLIYDNCFGEHHGIYHCEACHFKTPPIDFHLNTIEKSNPLKVNINNETFEVALGGQFNAYNLIAAISLSQTLSIDTPTIKIGLQAVQAPKGRMEHFEIKDKDILFNLSKNAIGVNETFKNLNFKNEMTLCLIFENKAHDGIDASWIKQIDFTQLKKLNIKSIFLAGALKDKVKNEIENQLSTSYKIQSVSKRSEIIKAAMLENPKEIVVIPNYTPMTEIRNAILEEIK